MVETILKIAGVIGALGVILGILLKILHTLRAVQRSQLCMMRNSITATYYRHIDEADPTLREYERKNLDELHAGYTVLRGNTFVHDLYETMRKWRVES